MSTRHLVTGSPLPEVNPNLVRIYSMRFCPFAERTRLVLAHKNIPHEIVNVNLKHKPEWMLERNPNGTVPILEYKGHFVYESAICNEFLEEEFPGTGPDALLPSCPFKRAAARLFMTTSDKKTISVILAYKATTPDKVEEEKVKWLEGLQQFEDHLTKTGEPFFGGSQVGMADLHIWPFFERAGAIGQLRNLDLLPASSQPRLSAWYSAMQNVDAVKKCGVSTDVHRRFFETALSDEPHYDLELE